MLKIENINVYYGAIHAIHELNIEVNDGEIVTLIGANGAGKTSTLRAISGLNPVKSGVISYDGKVSSGISQVPEGRRVFGDQTCEENLLLGAYLKKDKKQINETMEKVFTWFPRIKERRNQLAGTLSGGEQQMLAIGRSLMASPKLLLLDEPSMGLAPIVVEEIFEIIKSIRKEGRAIDLLHDDAVRKAYLGD